MQLVFNSDPRKRVAVGLAALVCATYIFCAGRLLLGSIYGSEAEFNSLQKAAQLDPMNADYQNSLGRYYALAARDPAAAIAPYRTALQLNPNSARYWFDLASTYQVLGDTQNQSVALDRAMEADPTTPDVAWEAANFYLVQGNPEKALREFRVVLQNEPTLANPAIQFCWRIRPDTNSLLRDVIPDRPEAYIAFLNLLMRKEQTADAAKVWAAMVASSRPFEWRIVTGYFNYLLEHKDVDQARLVWHQSALRFGLIAYLPSNRNLVVNGDFDLDVLNGGFDWQYEKQRSVTLTLDPSDFHGGRRSLSITFDGPGVVDAGISQIIAVQPHTAYRFLAYYKNGEMEGAGGPHLMIQDFYTKATYYDSDELKDASYWKSVSGDFVTAAGTKLVVMHVQRVPAGSPIRGKLWVDDFHLVPNFQSSN